MCWAATARRKPFPCRLALGSCAALLFLGGCAGTGPLSDDGGPVLSDEPETALLLDLPDGTKQEIYIQPEIHMAATWELRQEDLNFDGYPDFALDIGGDRGGSRYADALLWDETAQAYREEPSFMQISAPVLDPEHSVIWAGYDVNWMSCRGAYEIREGVFAQTHALSAQPVNQAQWSEGICCIEYALTDDGLTEVNRLEFPDEYDYTAALGRYLESGPVWSGWLWIDLQWHVQNR